MRTTEAASRREFIGRTAAAVAAGLAATRARAAATGDENPWRYDVDRLRRVDPALVHYERVSGFPVAGGPVRRLCVGPDNRIAVAAGRTIQRFATDGSRVAEWKLDDAVRALASGSDGRVFAALKDRVVVLDRQGGQVGRWPAFGGKAFLTGLAVAEREVFVADAGNRVVYRCDLAGRVQLRIGERDKDRGIPGLVLPSPFLDVEVGTDGLLRVNNPGRHQVEIYTRDGELERRWGRPGVAIDSFCGCCNPIGLALLPGGQCVTAEKGLPRVKIFDANGRLESVVAAPDQFAAVSSEDRDTTTAETSQDGLDVAVDGQGKVYVLDLVGATVQVFQRKGAASKAA